MARDLSGLTPEEIRNYRDIRAVALFFIVLGSMFGLASLIFVFGGVKADPKWSSLENTALGVVMLLFGLSGVVGGIAVRMGNRQWGGIIRFMGWFYIIAFPIGTILSYTLLKGLKQYFTSMDRIRR